MFNEIEMAKARCAELVAKYYHPLEFEGVKVQVPNAWDHVILAVREALSKRAAKVQKPLATRTHSQVVAE